MLKFRDFELKPLYENIKKGSSLNLLPIEKLNASKDDYKLPIYSDAMFHTMFYNTKRIKYACKLFSYFFDESFEELMKKTTLIKGELDKDTTNTKSRRIDFLSQVGDSKVGIEVNNCSLEDTMERNLEYAFKEYSEKNKKGDKEEHHDAIVQININNFSFTGNDNVFDVFTLRNDKGIVLTPKIVIIQIYLPNLHKKMYNEKEELTERERYLSLLLEPNLELSSKFKIKGDKIMNDYLDEAKKASHDESLVEKYSIEYEYTNMGKSIGEKKGREETKTEIVKNMLEDNVDIEKIIQYTGLTEEHILEIKNKEH